MVQRVLVFTACYALSFVALGGEPAPWAPMAPNLLLEQPLAQVIEQKGPPASGSPEGSHLRYNESWFALPNPVDADYLALGDEPMTMHQITLNFPKGMKREEILKSVDATLGPGEQGPSAEDAPSKYFGLWIRDGVRFDLQDFGDYIEMYIAPARLHEPEKYGLPEDTAAIQSVQGNIVPDDDPERALLAGVYALGLASQVQRLHLIIQDTGDKADVITPLPEGSAEVYAPECMLHDFNGDGLADVMVRAKTGGNGDIYTALIYSYASGAATKIFDTAEVAPPAFHGALLDGYKATLHVDAPATDVELDLSDRRARYDEQQIYNNGVVAKPTELWGQAFGPIAPVDMDGDRTFELRVVQQVRATSDADRVAEITSIVKLSDGTWTVTESNVTPLPAE